MTKLWYGPVIGEFGHEIAAVPAVRRTSREYERTTVCSRPGREALYADFAAAFTGHDILCEGMCQSATRATMPDESAIRKWLPTDPTIRILRPAIYDGGRVEAHRYGNLDPQWKGAVVVHARTRGYCPERNWRRSWWNQCARALFKVGVPRLVAIGSREAATTVEGAVDMRGVPLQVTMDILRSARAFIGPSSGPAHLASHCGCPHFVWCGGATPEHTSTRRRYERLWNPLGTKVMAIPYNSWQPEVPYVLERFLPFLEGCKA